MKYLLKYEFHIMYTHFLNLTVRFFLILVHYYLRTGIKILVFSIKYQLENLSLNKFNSFLIEYSLRSPSKCTFT